MVKNSLMDQTLLFGVLGCGVQERAASEAR